MVIVVVIVAVMVIVIVIAMVIVIFVVIAMDITIVDRECVFDCDGECGCYCNYAYDVWC